MTYNRRNSAFFSIQEYANQKNCGQYSCILFFFFFYKLEQRIWRRENLSLNRVNFTIDDNKWKCTRANVQEDKSIKLSIYISLFATLRLAGRPGRDGCQSALWDCFGGRICHHVENSSPKAVTQCTLKPSRLSLQRNLKVANMKTFLKMGIHTFKKNRVFIHFCGS